VTACARLEEVLARPDVAPLIGDVRIAIGDDARGAFAVHDRRRATISVAALGAGADTVTVVRHALELCSLLGMAPDDPVLAGLMAARCAALFRAIAFPPGPGAAPPWHTAMAGPVAPDQAALEELWPALAARQPGAPRRVPPDTAVRLAALWPFLGPTEYMITAGGDTRLHVDPDTGLNAYGCSPRPRPWAITFASSTASSISERGYAVAEAARRRMLGDALGGGDGRAREAARLRRAIAGHYGLPGDARVVLVPSGTDGELLALGIALAGDPARPLTNLLVGPEESGGGVPQAAAGRHFCTVTARGVAVVKGGAIDGVPRDLEVSAVPVRAADGALRPAAEMLADCVERTADAVGRGRRVLFHILDQSKTGLLAPRPAGPVWSADPGAVDVIVDASQARLTAASVQGYVQRGAMVLLTGSKFFTGPPFAGALVVPAPLAPRLEDGARRWPAGFADYFEDIHAGDGGPFVEVVSVGLALRWEAALAEMDAFAAMGETAATGILRRFGDRIGAAITANPDLCRLAAAPLERPEFPEGWDGLPTIFTFSVLRPGDGGPRRPFDLEEAKRLYVWLNTDLSGALPSGAPGAERRLAARLAHIGQPVAVAGSGVFRLSAGARVVSGEPSQLHLDLEARIEREIDDALAVLDKVSLIVRHLESIRTVNPPSRF